LTARYQLSRPEEVAIPPIAPIISGMVIHKIKVIIFFMP
jgi:hypothetical protein